MLFRALVLVAVIVGLLAFQVKSADDKPPQQYPIQFILASAFFGPAGAAGGLWYRELLTRILTGVSMPLELKQACQDVRTPATQGWLAFSATLPLLALHDIRSHTFSRGYDFAELITGTILIYTGGVLGARIAAHELCQRPQLFGQNPQQAALNIWAITAIVTGLAAAFVFNMIWVLR